MGKNKIARWAELGTFPNVIQPAAEDVSGKPHPVRGNWRRDIFRNDNPVVLELACGRGEYTTSLSSIFPGRNFIGIDIKGARMWRGAKTASETGLSNTAFLRTRIEFISSFFAEDEVDEIWMIFPDPHPGKRNSNKRLTCPWFLEKYRVIMKDGGLIHLKTDNFELFNYTRNLALSNSLEILFETSDLYSPGAAKMAEVGKAWSGGEAQENTRTERILGIRTHYEDIFLKDGMKICHLAFRLEKDKKISDAGKEKG